MEPRRPRLKQDPDPTRRMVAARVPGRGSAAPLAGQLPGDRATKTPRKEALQLLGLVTATGAMTTTARITTVTTITKAMVHPGALREALQEEVRPPRGSSRLPAPKVDTPATRATAATAVLLGWVRLRGCPSRVVDCRPPPVWMRTESTHSSSSTPGQLRLRRRRRPLATLPLPRRATSRRRHLPQATSRRRLLLLPGTKPYDGDSAVLLTANVVFLATSDMWRGVVQLISTWILLTGSRLRMAGCTHRQIVCNYPPGATRWCLVSVNY